MYRETVYVAHALASSGATCANLICWILDFPIWLRAVVMHDIDI